MQLEYLIQIQEIKPWSPTQSLRALRAVQIQWEHGNRSSGSTNQVVPSIPGIGERKIEFNESFRLLVALIRDASHKEKDAFLKNCIEFNLYELRREKAVKGQLLGTAIIDLAAYGVVKESLSVSTLVNCKHTYWNSVQPILYLKIQLVERRRRNYSMDRSNYDSVSVLSEEYVEEGEGASICMDDDISSHSALGVTSAVTESSGSSSPQTRKNVEDVDDENTSSSPRRQVLNPERSNTLQNGPTDDDITEKLQVYADEKDISKKEDHTEDNPLSALSDHKIEHLEQRIRTLERELREAATVKISLYSVIAEHGSSMTKVHAPARRLSRFYFHASKEYKIED